MRKLRRLSVLFVLSMIIPGYIYASNDNDQTENTSAHTISYTANNSVYEGYSLSETKETSASILKNAQERRWALYVGYSGNFKNGGRDREKDNKYNHIAEIGGAYTKQLPSKFGYSLYAGADVMFNSENFWVGPKAGANINYSIVMIGGEFIGYTNGNFAKPFFKPYVGIGVGPLKVTAGYNLELGNKATFKEINSFTVGVTIPLFWGGN